MKNGVVGFGNLGLVAIALVAVSLFAVLNVGVSGQGILGHTSAVTLTPDQASCGDIPNEFTISVENTGGAGDIYDVKIAKTQVNIQSLDNARIICQDPICQIYAGNCMESVFFYF